MLKKRLQRRLASLLARMLQTPRVALYSLLSNNKYEGLPRRFQPLQTVGLGTIEFGSEVTVGCFPSPLFFSTYAYVEARQTTATVSIGRGTWINNDFSAIAEHTCITIGQNCLIGTSVEILDSDFHGIKVEERMSSRPEWARPVTIGNNVFIGSNVKIMKGVVIGNGSVIANGSIVTKDVPPGVIIGGNPAKVLRVIEQ
jgi:maltose O-acetyltransferase